MSSLPLIADLESRRATVCQLLHCMATGRTNPQAPAEATRGAIKPIKPQVNALMGLSPGLLQEWACAAEYCRCDSVIGLLDGIPVAIEDNLDVVGKSASGALPGRKQPVMNSAALACHYRSTRAMMQLVRHRRAGVSA